MAFNNITTPGSMVFAGNPVVISGNTDAVGTYTGADEKTHTRLFPCVLGKFTTSTYTEEYTYPVADDGSFQFDLSGALQECARQMRKASLSADTGPTHTPGAITYSLQLTESWHEEGVTYTGDTTTISNLSAVPGALTDAERTRLSNGDVSSLLSSGKAMTRKPDSTEVVVKGMYHIVPYMNGAAPAYDRTQRGATGTFTIRGHKIYVTDEPGDFLPIAFWNGFGLLESATGHCLPTYQHNFQSAQYEVDNGNGYTDLSEQHAQTTLQQQVITMNSGLVTREWYEWWVSEVLTTPQIFVRLEGRWYSGTVVPESSITRHGSSGNALSVEFKVKLSVKGSIYNSWV